MSLNCKNITDKMIDLVEGNLPQKESEAFYKHIELCSSCQKELQETRQFLTELSNQKEGIPSEKLRLNFEKMLADEQEISTKKVIQLNDNLINWKAYLRVAASVLLIVSAFFLGKYQSQTESFLVANQTKITQQQDVLALIENTSASKRIMAVNQTENFTPQNTQIIQALINRLFFDKNTNVRSAAAEALSKFTSEEMVKMALIKALETEEDSSIQIELIRILTKIQEKRAVKPMQELLKKEETPQFVKLQVQQHLSNLL